jgi:hypothetical protein
VHTGASGIGRWIVSDGPNTLPRRYQAVAVDSSGNNDLGNTGVLAGFTRNQIAGANT